MLARPVLAALLAGSVITIAGGAAAEEPTIPAVDKVIEGYLGVDSPGIAVAVLDHGDLIHLAAYGYADIDEELPLQTDSIFDLASVSKQMTALAARMQIDEGLYAPDTPVADVLPAFKKRKGDPRPLTVGDLIHHLSGLADYLSGDMEVDGETTNDEVIDWLVAQPLDHPPGVRFDYSNSGYLTLGSLVAAADEADSLATVLDNRVFTPAGMEDTAVVTPVDPDRLVTGYAGTGGKFEESSDPSIVEGDGNVFSTIADLARYEAALAGDELVAPDVRASLFENGVFDDGSPLVAADDDDSGYGFGWSLEVSDGDEYASHSGSWMGTATYFQRNLTTGITVIVLSNGEDLGVADVAGEVEAALEDE